jgi:hypothetical protein
MVFALVDGQHRVTLGYILPTATYTVTPVVVDVVEPVPSATTAGRAVVHGKAVHPSVTVPAVVVVSAGTHLGVSFEVEHGGRPVIQQHNDL